MPYKTLVDVKKEPSNEELLIQKILAVPLQKWNFSDRRLFLIEFEYNSLYILSNGKACHIDRSYRRYTILKDKRVGELVKTLYKLHKNFDKEIIIKKFLSRF